jgi:hypothetical protein
MNIPPSFVHSYKEYETYPCHPVYRSSSSFALDSYKARLDEVAPELFTSDDAETDVRVLDSPLGGGQGQYYPSGALWSSLTRVDFTEETVIGDIALKACLGDDSIVEPLTGRWIGPVATKKDPKCRFM